MIQQLKPETFRQFGTILPESEHATSSANRHSICLLPDNTSSYQTVADTHLRGDQGLTILCVSTDGVAYQEFYLDKPLVLHRGIWFTLTAFQNTSTVSMAGTSLPRLLETKASALDLASRPQLQVTALYTLFYQEKEPGFLFPGEAHTMLELTYVDRGTLHSVADGLDLLLQQGDMVLYSPGQWHMQYADIGVAPRYVTISFLATDFDVSSLINRCLKPTAQVLALLQQILREQEDPQDHSSDMCIHLLEILLLKLLRDAQCPTSKLQMLRNVNNENQIIRRAQQYISANVRQKLTVPSVAKHTDVSSSYLTALFHKHLQISPGEYIRRIKLQESKQLIREGVMSFTEIAEALEYSTVHHFSRQFKEKFGLTPTQYAKSVR